MPTESVLSLNIGLSVVSLTTLALFTDPMLASKQVLQVSSRFELHFVSPRGEFRPRQTRQLPRAVDLKGRLLSCQSY